MFFVKSKHPMAKVGIAWATDLISTSFAALDRCFSVHIAILFPKRSRNGWNRSFFIRPSGVASNSTCCTPSMFLISYLCCVPMLSRVSREHFSGLSFCPVLSSNFCSTNLTLSACSVFALKKSRASSANNRCEIPGACREIFSSFKVPSWTSFCNNKDRASATKRKRYGDSGSPWRNPRVGWKDSRGIPLRQLEVTNSGDAAHHPSHL